MSLLANLWRRRPRRMLRIVAMESDSGVYVVARGELSGGAACGLALRLLAPLQQHARPEDDAERIVAITRCIALLEWLSGHKLGTERGSTRSWRTN